MALSMNAQNQPRSEWSVFLLAARSAWNNFEMVDVEDIEEWQQVGIDELCVHPEQ
jgi:hypothetical protein